MKRVAYVLAIHTDEMRANVAARVDNGYDLYGPMFVTNGNMLCVPMVESASVYDYVLVSADSIGLLEKRVNDLVEGGFDLLHGVLHYSCSMLGGVYLQWMCKMHTAGQSAVSYAGVIYADS